VKQWEQEQDKSREAAIPTLKSAVPVLEQPGYDKNKLIS